MADIKVKVNGGSIDQFLIDFEVKLEKFMSEFGIEFYSRLRRRTPVDTGRLKNSWGMQVKETGVEIWNETPYAAYVEFGTPKMAPRAMLRTTTEEAEEIAEIALRTSGLSK